MNRTMKNNRNIKVHPATISLLVDATWDYAHEMLWHNFPFSNEETELAKMYIREYYEGVPAHILAIQASAHFASYCERIAMAKRYVLRSPQRFIPHPCLWLNKNYSKGFAGTRAWYEQNQAKQKRCKLKAYLPYTGLESYNPLKVQFHYNA
jgi:hypothetical protein